ncbi:MAG: MarR family winged helix-turn-helix transcriptional regulator [Candidatus Muiribacteriaceae bacterium]
MDNIEEMIQTSSIGGLTFLISRFNNVFIGRELEEFGLGAGQYLYLLTLYHNEGITQNELAERLFINKGCATRALNKLEENGYIIRKRNEKDRRAINLYVTEKALKIRDNIYDIIRKRLECVTSDLSMEEKDTLKKLLQKVASKAVIEKRKHDKQK